ncbi:hypothetical protein ABTE38_19295, partial [Acinetobacter baumannii]
DHARLKAFARRFAIERQLPELGGQCKRARAAPRISTDRDHSVKLGFFTPAAAMGPLTERRSTHPAL